MTIETAGLIALIAAVIATLADSVTTRIGMRRGLVEVGTLVRIAGERVEVWELLLWTAIEMALLIGSWLFIEPNRGHVVAYAVVTIATGFLAVRNIVRLRRAQ